MLQTCFCHSLFGCLPAALCECHTLTLSSSVSVSHTHTHWLFSWLVKMDSASCRAYLCSRALIRKIHPKTMEHISKQLLGAILEIVMMCFILISKVNWTNVTDHTVFAY